MATKLLTQKTGFSVGIPNVGSLTLPPQVYFGWQVGPTTAQDLVTASTLIGLLGYHGKTNSDPDNELAPTTIDWALHISKANANSANASPTDWIVSDGRWAWVEADVDVQAIYDITTY